LHYNRAEAITADQFQHQRPFVAEDKANLYYQIVVPAKRRHIDSAFSMHGYLDKSTKQPNSGESSRSVDASRKQFIKMSAASAACAESANLGG
jgi:hypothetical protein